MSSPFLLHGARMNGGASSSSSTEEALEKYNLLFHSSDDGNRYRQSFDEPEQRTEVHDRKWSGGDNVEEAFVQ